LLYLVAVSAWALGRRAVKHRGGTGAARYTSQEAPA
jgi:hypothetical protein